MEKTCIAAAGLYCGLGMAVPVAPTIAGLTAVTLVRALLWSKNQSIKWNLCVCFLAMLATFVTVEGTDISTFMAFWMGVGYGGMGVGIVELGKNTPIKILKARFSKAAEAFMGTKSEPEETEDK